MTTDLKLLSEIWIEKYKSNDERDIEELICEMESEENATVQSLHEQSVLLR